MAHDALVKLDRGRDALEDVYVDFVYQPLRACDGAVLGIMAHAVETTEQVRLRKTVERHNEDLARLAQALGDTNRELDQFAYVASHDLKAPLRRIANLAQWLEDDLGPHIEGESRQHLALLRSRVNRMEGLIEGILTYSRGGRVRSSPEPVSTLELVREAVDLIAPPGTFVIDVPQDLPIVVAEPIPLQQVFSNLLANAVKYTRAIRDDGHVRVTWSDGGAEWQCAIIDDGPGIATEYHDRIWSLFQTLESRDKVEGTGIGLSVVKKIVETRGGQVGVESQAGAGATFRFTWPKSPRPAAAAPRPGASSSAAVVPAQALADAAAPSRDAAPVLLAVPPPRLWRRCPAMSTYDAGATPLEVRSSVRQ